MFPGLFLTPIFVGSTLNPINSSIIATALVPIAAAFDVPVGQTAVLLSSLYVASAVAQPTFGRLAAQFGPRRLFLIGIVLVLVGGVVGTFAPAFVVLILARVIIGIGTSAAYPTAIVLIRRRAEQYGIPPPGRILGLQSIVANATIALGLPLGGVLVYFFGWRGAFAINIPTSLIAIGFALAGIPRDPKVAGVETRRNRWARFSSVDPWGIALFAASLSFLLAFLLTVPETDYLLLVPALASLAAFLLHEHRHSAPFVDLRYLVRNHALSRTYARTILSMLVTYSLLYGLTQWLIGSRGLTPSMAGLVMLPMSLMSLVITYPIARRNLVRWPIRLGVLTALAVAASLAVIGDSTAVWMIVALTVVGGIASSTSITGNQGAMYGQASLDTIGTAAGLLRTSIYMGAIAASALISIAFAGNVTDTGLHHMAFVLLGACALYALLVFSDRRIPRHIQT